jgi:Spy/CpxP family protein refolding chaperone
MRKHQVTSGDETLQSPSGARRRFLAGVVTGGLLASLLAGGASLYAQARPRPGRWFGAGHGLSDPEMAGERAAFATDWILHRIDASEEQRRQVRAIVQAAVKDLLPMRDQHHQYRQALREALTQPTVNRSTLEEARRAELQLADQASSRVVEAMASAAEVLTPEQRAKLAELADRWHR